MRARPVLSILHPALLLLATTAVACQATVNVGKVSATEADSEADSTIGPDGTTTAANTTADPGGTTSSPDGTTTGGTNSTTTGPGDTTTGGTSGTTTSDQPSTSDGTTGGGDSLVGWTRYREVLIDHSVPVDLSDFQVYIDVEYDSDMAPDYSDLRFTDSTGTNLLPYWIESDTGPVDAFVWVRVPAVAGDDITTIRMYYGNPNAAPASDGFATFLFFDDFEAGQLDAAKWKTTAPVTVDFGRLQITKGAVYSTKPVGDFPGTNLDARLTFYTEGNVSSSVLVASRGQTTDLAYMWRMSETVRIYDGMKTVFEEQGSGNTNVPIIVGMGADAEAAYFRYWINFEKTVPGVVAYPYYALLGHFAGKLADLQETQNVDVDWIRVRRLVKPEPVTFVGGENNL